MTELTTVQKAALFGIKAASLMEYGNDNSERALEYAIQARQLDPSIAEWHFIFGNLLGKYFFLFITYLIVLNQITGKIIHSNNLFANNSFLSLSIFYKFILRLSLHPTSLNMDLLVLPPTLFLHRPLCESVSQFCLNVLPDTPQI